MSRLGSVRLRRFAYFGVPAGVALAYYNYPRLQDLFAGSSVVPGNTIEVPVRVYGPDGKRMSVKQTHPRLSQKAVDEKIRENALGQRTQRPNGIVWRYQTAFLEANNGIEDGHAQALVERDITPLAPPGDLLFFAVMDGHAGPETSRLLSKALIPAVAAEMSSLIKSATTLPPKTVSTLSYIKSFFTGSPRGTTYEFDADPVYVSAALRAAFSKLDSRIINAPINLLSHLEAQGDSESKYYEHPMAKDVLLPAISGSCALLAMLDTSRRDMYVACAGDSRAVAGYWDQPKDGSPGSWRVDVLTEDQTGRNLNELKRMQSEHPSDEANFVIQRGRVLGGLEPTRAFGDARYKWPKDVGNKLVANLLPPNTPVRRAPTDLKTPPYVTADPVVTHRKLSFLPPPPTSSSSPATTSTPASEDSTDPEVDSTLKFVVLATDGLWDELSSKDVVALVGGHLSGIRSPSVSSSTIPVYETEGAQGVEGKDSLDRLKQSQIGSTGIDEGKRKTWAFVDDNIGTHLIRNALGGTDEKQLTWLTSIPSGLARNFRDDITVTVIWYETASLSNGSGKGSDVNVKAKL